jgi:hypothetical protein
VGRAADAGKFNIQPIKRFDCYLENHRFLPNSNKVCLTPFSGPTLQFLQFDVGGDLGDPVIFRNPT